MCLSLTPRAGVSAQNRAPLGSESTPSGDNGTKASSSHLTCSGAFPVHLLFTIAPEEAEHVPLSPLAT